MSRAFSIVTPLCLRHLGVLLGELLAQVAGAWVDHRRGRQVDAEFGCARPHLGLVAENGQVRRWRGAAAGPPPAGSGRRHPRAARSVCGRRAPAPSAGRRTSAASSRVGIGIASRASSVRRCRRGVPSATARCRSCSRRCAVTRPRVVATALAVSKVSSSVAMIGSRKPTPVTSRAISRCSGSPPLRMMVASDGKPSAAWALATASTTSERSPGVITAAPSCSRSRTCSAVIPATITRHHLPAEQRLVAVTRVPSTARQQARPRSVRPAAVPRA